MPDNLPDKITAISKQEARGALYAGWIKHGKQPTGFFGPRPKRISGMATGSGPRDGGAPGARRA